MFAYVEILMALAVVPALFLVWKIYQLDKIEKEPGKLLFGLFCAGALSTVSAIILELIGTVILNLIFAGHMDVYGSFDSELSFYVYNFFMYFIVVACSEEFGKYFALKKITWKNKEFDYRFDAVVYAVCVGAGFAVLENIEYVFQYGVATALTRAVTAIPGHIIFAIFMGHFYGLAKEAQGKGDVDQLKKNMKLSFWVPVLLHGFYDFCASGGSTLFGIIFLVFIVALDVVAFKQVKLYSATDKAIPNMGADTAEAAPFSDAEAIEPVVDPMMEDLINKYANVNNNNNDGQ